MNSSPECCSNESYKWKLDSIFAPAHSEDNVVLVGNKVGVNKSLKEIFN